MSWLCIFFPHRWVHIIDVSVKSGIWQCERCKRISIGRVVEYSDLIRKNSKGAN
jgi:hypothetical protein